MKKSDWYPFQRSGKKMIQIGRDWVYDVCDTPYLAEIQERKYKSFEKAIAACEKLNSIMSDTSPKEHSK